MIERYTTPEMARIWSDENKYETWKKVEITVTEVLSDRGEVPKEAVKVINEKAMFSVERILEIEKTTRHDVIAFLTNLSENIGPESRFIHMGMTSSDLLDTSLALLCKEAGEIILTKLNTFKDVLPDKLKLIKQGLPVVRKLIDEKNNDLIKNVLNQKKFKETNIWESKNIIKDFNNPDFKSKKISQISKIAFTYLLLEGFDNRKLDSSISSQEVRESYNKLV